VKAGRALRSEALIHAARKRAALRGTAAAANHRSQSRWAAAAERLDQRRSRLQVIQATCDIAVAAENAANAMITAGQAEVARLKSQIAASTLVASSAGRIQYKLARPGELLPAVGRVLTLLDLSDIYMTIFEPASVAGHLIVGGEAWVTLDPGPSSVFSAKVTFVATEAQFTPKTVETGVQREKLVSRVRLLDPPNF
jgi:HlyD family secretion protein